MSQTATILPKCAVCCVSPFPFPPTPMQAMFSTSFGPTPPAHPCRPLAKTPNPATEAPYRNDRRLVDGIMAKFSSVSLECPIATRHSLNDQEGEPYDCILQKPFSPCHIPARDRNPRLALGFFMVGADQPDQVGARPCALVWTMPREQAPRSSRHCVFWICEIQSQESSEFQFSGILHARDLAEKVAGVLGSAC